MKLKYYLRGLGIGILITTIIFMIFIRVDKNHIMTDKEIMARAEELGMVMQEEDDSKTLEQLKEEEGQQTPEDTQNTTENAEDGQEQNTPQTVEQVQFNILPGEYSDVISQKLFDAGLIDDKAAFNEFIINSDYDNFIQTGDFTIPKGASYEEIAKILTTKKENR
ncbi:MAG: hypothetical protein SO445_10995 [Lachnospiraceae bacterium]|nr:hypothetical protein [Lachnospiraceae bacterium]MDD7378857.1 hypothetical protein [Lachnospiraceae bacterium]MDY4618213.1 hypothetical protein [Lachnospiraceae bacterium]MDY5774789.1 hypothetical protein [Lachnospiraceae bacterium]